MNKPRIMGILNVTPDSFSDGGQFNTIEKAIDHAERLIRDGADIIDIGGESTRPGADPVSIQEELDRTIPVIEKLKDCGTSISIDTRHAIIMDEAIKAGATIINDVSALEDDPKSLETAAQYDCPICIMHKRGNPQTMQSQANYTDIVQDVYNYLQARIHACENAGIDKDRLIIDPGLGFAKTADHNLALLKNLNRFHNLGVPVLIGASRKRFIENIMGGETPADQRLGGSLAVAIYAASKGASILRVHDVYETVQALKIWRSIDDSSPK